MSNATKNFGILAIGLSILQNYFDNSTKLLFWSVSPAKILDLSAKLLFPHESESWNTESRDIKLGIRVSGVYRFFFFLTLIVDTFLRSMILYLWF